MILDHVYNNNSIEYPMVVIYWFFIVGFFRWFFPDLNLVVMLEVVNPTYSKFENEMSTENWLLFTPYVGASEQGGWGGKGQAP